MRNREAWRPGRFLVTKKGLKASRDSRQVGLGSRFIGDLQGVEYARAIRSHARGLLLDLGCGNVPLYQFYRDLVTDNVCVDWVHTSHKSEHLDHECDLNQELPLPSGHFDTILATDVLEHIADPDRLWQEMSRLVRPGGKIILTVPFLYWIHEAPHDYARYTEFQLNRFCERHGLGVASLKACGGSVEAILDIIAKHLAFSRVLSAIHLGVSKGIVRLIAGREFYKRIARQFPLFYVLVAEKPAG